jgi:RNA polymerase sigma factor (sigma-70 family)
MGSIQPEDEAARKKEIDDLLSELSIELGENLLAEIKGILYSNLARSRINKFIEQNPIELKDYVSLVISMHERYRDQVRLIQIEKSNDHWIVLKRQLDRWAYRFLSKKGLPPTPATFKLAQDYATEASITVLRAHFPYDTSFESWAYVLLRYVCLRQFEKANKKSNVPDHLLVELNEDLSQISDPEAGEFEQKTGRRQQIEAALEQVSTERMRQVIRLYYYEGLSYSEIAERWGKTVNAVYKAHFDALKDLRKILNEEDDINE